MRLECLQIGRNVLRDIQIANDHVDHVGEVVQTPKARGAVLGDLDEPVDALVKALPPK